MFRGRPSVLDDEIQSWMTRHETFLTVCMNMPKDTWSKSPRGNRPKPRTLLCAFQVLLCQQSGRQRSERRAHLINKRRQQRTTMGVRTALVSLALTCFISETSSFESHRHVVLRIVGGSTEAVPDDAKDSSFTEAPASADDDSKGAFVSSIKTRLDKIRERTPKLNIGLGSDAMDNVRHRSSKFLSVLGPAAVSFARLFYHPSGRVLLTKSAIYALALVGSSSGFKLFLYFITVGYACGVTLPVLVAMIVYNIKFRGTIPLLTNVHSGLAILWCVRSTWFFLYREYVNWPQLHIKIVEVDKLARPSSKIFCWLVYSLFYVPMTTPFLCRMEAAAVSGGAHARWGRFGFMSLGLQVYGLLLETIADHQKMVFKSQPGNRHRWCNVGLWKYSTHPNYVGEILFWMGAFLGGVACYQTPQDWTMAIIGIAFISIVLRGARVSLDSKHRRKYGTNVEFLDFCQSHGLWGPIPWNTSQNRQLSL